MNMNKYEEIERCMKSRPYVVVLGAGASCATIPNGDKNGKKISAMNGFISELGLSDILSSIVLHTESDNLEDIYMEIDERSKNESRCKIVKDELEEQVRKYMESFRLPDEPTIYDFLLLSLTEKDLVATFNWDPLLVQALKRVSEITQNLPSVVFLHGNVAVGFCPEHDYMGIIGTRCKCEKMLKPVKLLFPVKDKDYKSDPAIQKGWSMLNHALEKAYMVTIFGYSAPKSDVNAIAMMENAWGKTSDRNMEEIELIDIRSEEDVKSSWEKFIHTHHYRYYNSFFDSALAKYPRRTCEALFDRTLNNRWLSAKNGFREGMSFDEISEKISGLIAEEIEAKSTYSILSNPYVKNIFSE